MTARAPSFDWTCPRCRYWSYEFKGRGLAPLETPEELAFGAEMARQTEHIKKGEPWSVEGFEGWKDVGKEDVQALALGLLVGYETIVWPFWMEHYELVHVEREMPLELTLWLTYNSKPDTVVRRKSDGTLWYGPEDKTTKWVDSLLHYAGNVQLHATAFCIEHHLLGQERVSGCLVQGLFKGYVKNKQFYHPLVYAYMKEGIHGIVPDMWTHKWTRGYERTPVSQYPGGVREWIKRIPKEEMPAIFPMSPPVTINRELALKYLVQVEEREKEIKCFHEARALPEGGMRKNAEEAFSMDKVFPQHFNQCEEFGKSRKPCRARDLCFNPTTQRFPMSVYKFREPHHENEKQALGGEHEVLSNAPNQD